ncbi:MAG: putative PurR-regulated permease PerM [Cognaticolwellia sp.]|jgi:predicted PurR-regulated permease PerM
MENISVNLISLITFVIVILVLLLLVARISARKNRFAKKIDELQQQLNSQEIQLLELQDLLARQQSQLEINQQHCTESKIENEQVSKQLEHRIKVTQEQFNNQFQSIEQLLHQPPEDKLYTRAQKLVALGAGLAEIMRECDIPRAEAEMLLSIHQRKAVK